MKTLAEMFGVLQTYEPRNNISIETEEPIKKKTKIQYLKEYRPLTFIEESNNPEIIVEEPEQKKKPTTKMTRLKTYTANQNPVKTIIDFFINKGFSKEVAAGFVGNFLAESNLDPEAYNKAEKNKGLAYGRGIAQWSNERIKQGEQFLGKPIEKASLNEQLEFVWHELQQRPTLLNTLKNSDLYEATDAIYRGYENGSKRSLASPQLMQSTYEKSWSNLGFRGYQFDMELQNRQNQAIKALNIYES